jgi:hypothetical protein
LGAFEVRAVIGDELVERQIDLADQNAVGVGRGLNTKQKSRSNTPHPKQTAGLVDTNPRRKNAPSSMVRHNLVGLS